MKAWLFKRSVAEAKGFGMRIAEEHCNPNTPWGAYIRITEESLNAFYGAYWQNIVVPYPNQLDDGSAQRLDPKILIVAPGVRLSLQYHHLRHEHWRVLDGPVMVVIGDDQQSLNEIVAQPGDVIRLPCGKWHRLVGMDHWGRVAEIWEHTDPEHPSEERDIVRVEDDFGREG